MRLFQTVLFTLLLAAPMAQAQEDSVFREYDDYAAFVDKHVMTRQFDTLILRLGGRGEFTPAELADNVRQLTGVWPRDFTNKSVFRREDLGGGISQEARIYWTGKQYAYFYGLLHTRDDGFVVLSFNLNTSSKRVLERF